MHKVSQQQSLFLTAGSILFSLGGVIGGLTIVPTSEDSIVVAQRVDLGGILGQVPEVPGVQVPGVQVPGVQVPEVPGVQVPGIDLGGILGQVPGIDLGNIRAR
jgi:hypothetical protein